jgi:hypothetical protein
MSCFWDRRGICLWEFMLCAAYEMSVWAFMLFDPKESCLWDVMLFSWKSYHVMRLPLWEFKLVCRNTICLWDVMFFSCILFLRDFMVLGCYELSVWDVILFEPYEISWDHVIRVHDFEMVYEMSLWDVFVRDFLLKFDMFSAAQFSCKISLIDVAFCWTVMRFPYRDLCFLGVMKWHEIFLMRLHAFGWLCDFLMTLCCVLLDNCLVRFDVFC